MKIPRFLLCLLFLAAGLSLRGGVTVSTTDGKYLQLTIRPDKTSPNPGDTVTFTATYEIQEPGKSTWIKWPNNLPLLAWTATSSNGNLLNDSRVSLNKAAGKLTIRNVRADDREIQVSARFKPNSFDVVFDDAPLVKVNQKQTGGGGHSGAVGDDVMPPKPAVAALSSDFVHAIRGGGKFPAGSRVELSVALKPGLQGNKGVRIDWFFHGKPFRQNQPTLTIRNLTAAETGTYSAKVTRLQDNKTDTANVAVTLAK